MNNVDSAGHEPKSGSWQLRLIILVTVLPLVAAYVAYYTGWGVPQQTVNQGMLIEPAVDIKPLLEQSAGETPAFTDHTLWRLVVPVASPCDDACAASLYLTRQVHIRLGAKAERVERLALALGEQAEAHLQAIAESHPKLQVLPLSATAWQEWWRELDLQPRPDRGVYLLVDPQGFALMAYDANNDGGELLQDIKKILRFAPE